MLLWCVGILVPLFLFGHDLVLVRNGRLWNAAYWGRDFVIWWTAGQLIANGAIANVYNLAAFNSAIGTLFGPLDPMVYPYPPVTFPISAAFGLLPYWIAQPVWCAAGVAMFLYASRPWWTKEMGPPWLAVVTPAALMNMWAGHWAFFHGTLFLMGWYWLERRPRLSGMLFGAMLIKPHIALLLPIVLLIRRSWTTFVTAAATTAILVTASSLIYGWESWRNCFLNMVGPQFSVIGIDDTFYSFMSTSTTTAVVRATGNAHFALAAQLFISCSAIAALIAASRRKVEISDLALLTATLTFLVLPYGFDYDLTVVMIGALSIVCRPALPLSTRLMAAAGFLSPGIGLLLSSDGIPIVPLMLSLLACAQFRSLRYVKTVADSPTTDDLAIEIGDGRLRPSASLDVGAYIGSLVQFLESIRRLADTQHH